MAEATPVGTSKPEWPTGAEDQPTVTPPDVETLMRSPEMMAMLQRLLAEEAAKAKDRESRRSEAAQHAKAPTQSVEKREGSPMEATRTEQPPPSSSTRAQPSEEGPPQQGQWQEVVRSGSRKKDPSQGEKSPSPQKRMLGLLALDQPERV